VDISGVCHSGIRDDHSELFVNKSISHELVWNQPKYEWYSQQWEQTVTDQDKRAQVFEVARGSCLDACYFHGKESDLTGDHTAEIVETSKKSIDSSLQPLQQVNKISLMMKGSLMMALICIRLEDCFLQVSQTLAPGQDRG